MRFSVGDQVVEKAHLRARTNWLVYKIVALLGDIYLVEFDADGFGDEVEPYEDRDSEPGSRSWRSSIQKYQESELCSVEEAKQELHRLEEEQDQLKKDFDSVRTQVKTKMDQAARLVQEAGVLVEPTGKDFYDCTEECEKLYRALNDGGWSHSTMRCRYGR